MLFNFASNQRANHPSRQPIGKHANSTSDYLSTDESFLSKHILENNNRIGNKQQVHFLGFVSSEEVHIVKHKKRNDSSNERQKMKRPVSGLSFFVIESFKAFFIFVCDQKKKICQREKS